MIVNSIDKSKNNIKTGTHCSSVLKYKQHTVYYRATSQAKITPDNLDLVRVTDMASFCDFPADIKLQYLPVP